jgi:hypothetical protein
LNDFSRGVLEATAYYLSLDGKQLRKEMEQIRDDVLSGVAVTFRERIRIT